MNPSKESRRLWKAVSSIEGVLTLAFFGSRIASNEKLLPSSDLDVLLVIDSGKLKDFDFLTKLSVPLHEAGARLNLEVDLCLYEKEDLLQRLAERDSFLEGVIAQARYVQGQPLPPCPEPDTPAKVEGCLTEEIRPLKRAVSPRLCQNFWELATQSLRDAAFPDLSHIGKLSAATMTLQALAGLLLELTGRRSRRGLSHVDRITRVFEVLNLPDEIWASLKDVLELQQKVELFELYDVDSETARNAVDITAKCYHQAKAWMLKTYPDFARSGSTVLDQTAA